MIYQFLSIALFILIIMILSHNWLYRCFLLNKYKIVIDLLNYFLTESYNQIYVDQIFAYTSNGQKSLPKNERETAERNFIKLAFSLMGIENEKILISFFGTRVTLMNNMILFFRKKLDEDSLSEIIKNQELQLTSQDNNK